MQSLPTDALDAYCIAGKLGSRLPSSHEEEKGHFKFTVRAEPITESILQRAGPVVFKTSLME